jgi:arsenate reductase
MAEMIWKKNAPGWQVASAGSKPSGYVHPLAIKAIEESGLPTAGLTSKSVDQFIDQKIDLAITVCDNAAEDCPIMPGVAKTLHWPFEDPADAEGTDEQKFLVFQNVRDQIESKITAYLKSIQ